MSRFHNTLLDLVFTSDSENERRSAFKALVTTEFDGDLVFEVDGQKFNVVVGAIERQNRRRSAPKKQKKSRKRRAAKRGRPSGELLSKVSNYIAGEIMSEDDNSSAYHKLKKLASDAKKYIHDFEQSLTENKKVKLQTKEQILDKTYALTLAVMADDRKAVDFATHLLVDANSKGMRIANNRHLSATIASAFGRMAGIHMEPQHVKRAVINLAKLEVNPSDLENLMTKNGLTLFSLTNEPRWIQNRIISKAA